MVFIMWLTTLSPLFPCSAFLVARNGTVLAGNNEDSRYPLTKMWVVPGKQGSYGRIYFGYNDLVSQGGVNDKGLFYDGFATTRQSINKDNGKPLYNDFFVDFWDRIMSTCSTVEEVVAFMESYNFSGNPVLEHSMLMFGDAQGNSVIIEGEKILRKQGDFQLVTNFYQSLTDSITCERFLVGQKALTELEEVSVESATGVLQAMHTDYTRYSQVYDLCNGKIYVYNNHNYQECVTFDIAGELAKGPAYYDLPSLFTEHTDAYQALRNKYQNKQKALFNNYYNVQGDLPETAKMGDYRFENYYIPGTDRVILEDSAPTISLRKEAGGFYMRRNYGYSSEYQFFPEAEGRYFSLTRHFKFTLIFDEEDKLKLLVNLHQSSGEPWVMELRKQ